MMADPYAEFADPVESGDGYAALAEPAKPADYLGGLQSLLNSKGTTEAQVQDYVRQAGRDPSQLKGVQASLAYKAQNPDYNIPVEGLDQPAPETSALGSIGRGVLDTATLGFADEAGAGVEAGLRKLLYGQEFGKSYDEALERNRGLIHADEDQHPYARVAGQLLGGLAIPSGLEGVGYAAGRDALRAGASLGEARAIAQTAVRNRIVALGAGTGAVYGVGSGENADERLLGGVTGAGLGAAGGLVAGAAGSALANRARAAVPTAGQEVAQAAARQGIDVLPADVGGPMTRRMTGALAQTPFGAGPIIGAAQRMTEQGQGVRDRVASSIGQALNPEQAGETALQGARNYITRTSAQGNAMYRAAEGAAGNARVTPTQALANLDQHIADLAQTPGGAGGLDRLQGLRDALSQGDFSVQGIRNMRTALRDEFANAGLRGSDIERRVGQVVDAANQDVVTSLGAQGNGNAARLYQQADQYWRARIDTIDNTLAPIIGKEADKSGEQVVAGLQRAMQGNNARFSSFLNALSPAEQGDVRASLISRLGVATKGNQNAAGDAFSLQTFLSNWNDIGESAKNRLFGGEGRAALNDLARVASGAREAQRYANFSNTGGAIQANLFLTGITAIPTLGGSVIGQYGLGRLLASPRFVRWLARAPRSSLSTPAYVDRLTRIARSEPAIANDVLGIREHLLQAAQGSAPSAAQQVDNSTSVPPQQ